MEQSGWGKNKVSVLPPLLNRHCKNHNSSGAMSKVLTKIVIIKYCGVAINIFLTDLFAFIKAANQRVNMVCCLMGCTCQTGYF